MAGRTSWTAGSMLVVLVIATGCQRLAMSHPGSSVIGASTPPPVSTTAPTTTAGATPSVPEPSPPSALPHSPAAPSSAARGIRLVDGQPEPDRSLTPGSVFAGVGVATICVPGHTARVRDVPLAEREQIFASYSIPYADRSSYELDHLAPLELGGDNTAAEGPELSSRARRRPAREATTMARWLSDPATVTRYRTKVFIPLTRDGIADAGACWWWLGAIADTGHGRFWLVPRSADDHRRGRVIVAHRFGYMLDRGVVLPTTVHVRHACDETSCQNPRHWLAGSAADNAEDYRRRRRRARGPLTDLRGAAGRARAVRNAIVMAATDAEATEAATTAAIAGEAQRHQLELYY